MAVGVGGRRVRCVGAGGRAGAVAVLPAAAAANVARHEARQVRALLGGVFVVFVKARRRLGLFFDRSIGRALLICFLARFLYFFEDMK